MRSVKLTWAALAAFGLLSAACGGSTPDTATPTSGVVATQSTDNQSTDTQSTDTQSTGTQSTDNQSTGTQSASSVPVDVGDEPPDSTSDAAPTTTAPSPPAVPPGPTMVSGNRLPAYDDIEPGQRDPAVGLDAPVVAGTDMLTGAAVTTATGSPVLVGFYAHWCPHCQREVPEIVSWLDDNELPEGVDFVGISTFNDQARGNHPPDAWLARERWPLPVLADDTNEVAFTFGIASVPFTIAVTADGQIAGRVSGNIGPQGLVDLANLLLAEQADPTKVSGAALARFERSDAAQPDAALGADAPVVRGVDLLTGESVTSDAGAPALVIFYAHWCPHCQREVTEISDWLTSNDLPAGVNVISVSTFEDPSRDSHPPDEWLRREGWQLPVVADARGAAAEAFGVHSVPFTVAVTADGRVAGRVNGAVGIDGLVSLATQLLAGQAVEAEGGGSSSLP